MGWNQIIGQDTIVQMLQRSIDSGRVPQALLLTGEDGAGALAIATSFARILVGSKSTSLHHPNIKIITALPTGKGDIIVSLLRVKSRIERKGKTYDPVAERVMTNLLAK